MKKETENSYESRLLSQFSSLKSVNISLVLLITVLNSLLYMLLRVWHSVYLYLYTYDLYENFAKKFH